MRMRFRCAVLAACFASLLAGCASVELPPARPGAAALPAGFPEAYYRRAAAQGADVYRVDPAGSIVVIEVRRAGSLARLGHDHVVASHDVAGYVLPREGRADLAVPLSRLTVDEADLRSESGFDTAPSASDIAGTRSNMLNSVLEAERFPFALIRVSGVDAAAGRMSVAIELHGVARTLDVPARVETSADRLVVAGRLSLDQSDFGITPYTILGGAIAVRDRVDLRFRIQATRIDARG